MHPSVEVDGDIHIEAKLIADRGDPVADGLHLFEAVDVVHLLGAVHLQSAVSLLIGLAGSGADIRGTVAADPAVDLESVAAGAAQQFIDRNPERLALDVPESLIDAGDGAHDLRAAAVEAAPVHHLPDVLNAGGVLAGDQPAELLHAGAHRIGTPLDNRLSPAGNSFVGVDLQEKPAGRYFIKR